MFLPAKFSGCQQGTLEKHDVFRLTPCVPAYVCDCHASRISIGQEHSKASAGFMVVGMRVFQRPLGRWRRGT